MKITHNKEHCFLAVWALQQYGKYPRVADAPILNLRRPVCAFRIAQACGL